MNAPASDRLILRCFISGARRELIYTSLLVIISAWPVTHGRIHFKDRRANINGLTSWQTPANAFSRALAKLAASASAPFQLTGTPNYTSKGPEGTHRSSDR